MTPAEIECCIRDFHASNKMAPTTLVVGVDLYHTLLPFCAGDHEVEAVFFNGLHVLRDPEQSHGIVVSS